MPPIKKECMYANLQDSSQEQLRRLTDIGSQEELSNSSRYVHPVHQWKNHAAKYKEKRMPSNEQPFSFKPNFPARKSHPQVPEGYVNPIDGWKHHAQKYESRTTRWRESHENVQPTGTSSSSTSQPDEMKEELEQKYSTEHLLNKQGSGSIGQYCSATPRRPNVERLNYLYQMGKAKQVHRHAVQEPQPAIETVINRRSSAIANKIREKRPPLWTPRKQVWIDNNKINPNPKNVPKDVPKDVESCSTRATPSQPQSPVLSLEIPPSAAKLEQFLSRMDRYTDLCQQKRNFLRQVKCDKEMEGCTFKPEISDNLRIRQAESPRRCGSLYERGMASKVAKRQAAYLYQQEKENEELAECSFIPKTTLSTDNDTHGRSANISGSEQIPDPEKDNELENRVLAMLEKWKVDRIVEMRRREKDY